MELEVELIGIFSHVAAGDGVNDSPALCKVGDGNLCFVCSIEWSGTELNNIGTSGRTPATVILI